MGPLTSAKRIVPSGTPRAAAGAVHGGQLAQRGQRRRLALESRESIGIGGHGVWHHLDRNVTTELRIARAIHLPHSTGAEHGHDFVRAETATGGESHVGTQEYLHSWPRWGQTAVTGR